jgi:hypothetical protein
MQAHLPSTNSAPHTLQESSLKPTTLLHRGQNNFSSAGGGFGGDGGGNDGSPGALASTFTGNFGFGEGGGSNLPTIPIPFISAS